MRRRRLKRKALAEGLPANHYLIPESERVVTKVAAPKKAKAKKKTKKTA